MGDLWIQVLTRDDRDRQTLSAAFRTKAITEDAVGYEQMIRTDPARARLHDDVAVLYLELNRTGEAAAHFSATARLQPESASAHYNLATTLTLLGRLDEALDEFQQALRIRPEYALAHNNMGDVLVRLGKPADALPSYREAVRLDPTYAEAEYNIGSVSLSRGEFQDAADHFRKAMRLKADWTPPVISLAWTLATAPGGSLRDAEEAIRLAERAADLTGRKDARVLDILNAAHAAARTRR